MSADALDLFQGDDFEYPCALYFRGAPEDVTDYGITADIYGPSGVRICRLAVVKLDQTEPSTFSLFRFSASNQKTSQWPRGTCSLRFRILKNGRRTSAAPVPVTVK